MITYRKALMNDLEQIDKMVTAAIDNMEKHNIHQWDDIYPTKEDFKSDIEKGQLFIGFYNTDPAIIYTLNQECDDQYNNGRWKNKDTDFYIIHRLCVSPDFQNKGIACSALKHIEDQLKELGINCVRLDVFSENPYALRLYNNSGYSTVGHAEWRKGKFYLMEKYF